MKSSSHPQLINGYHIEGVWQEGGISTLYLAENPITHEHLIVKTLAHIYQEDPLARESLDREARVLSECHHPNIARILSKGTWKGTPFLALEFIRGISLRKILERNPIPLRRALDLLLELCSAVGHLHSLGYAHRDLKPENILVTDQGKIKLIDFGLAVPLHGGTPTSQLVYEGTPVYMSPESLLDSSIHTQARDIYALGVIAYEMILGRFAYGKVVLASLPKGLQPIVAKAVQPDPNNRYSSLVEFITAVTEYAQSESITKEKLNADYFFELYEQADSAQKKLLYSLSPQEMPNSSTTFSSSLNMHGMYAASIQQENTNGFIAIEFPQKGIDGLLASFTANSMLRILRKSPHKSTWDIFHDLHTELKALFSIKSSFFEIDLTSRQIRFFHEWGSFYLIQQNKEFIPIESTAQPELPLTQQLVSQDRILFLSLSPSSSRNSISEILIATNQLRPSQQSGNILQKLQVHGEWVQDDHPLCIFVHDE